MLGDNIPVGILTDIDIKVSLNELFSENANEGRAKYSTYEVVLDDGYEIIQHSSEGEILRLERKPENGLISVDPGETVLVFSDEVFTLPDNVYARVNTVGQIFLAGFSAENTYIDPGFYGRISITLINNSNRVLSMRQGAPLARIEFIKLSKKPEKVHPGIGGVRRSEVIPSIDASSAENYRKLDLNELINLVESSANIDVIQKKSIRTDIALTRTYEKLAEEARAIRESLVRHETSFSSQQKIIIQWQRISAFALATAVVLWFDNLGGTKWIVENIFPIGQDSSQPTYWKSILVNISCSVVATPIFSFLLGFYKNARNKKK